MSRSIIYAPEARAQLLQFQNYIGQAASPEIARDYVKAIVARCDGLADFPDRGTPRDDLRPSLRTIPFRRRVTIAYSVEPNEVTILGIFYGGQDFEEILKG